MNGTNRLEWIDISKGIGIILVVLAHTLVPQVRENTAAGFLWIFIYNFHMPLFFFISGYLFELTRSRHGGKGKFLLSKLRYLMLPYLTFSVFAYVFIYLALKIAPLASVLEGGGYAAVGIKDAVLQILTYNGHIDQHLWFVFSLFIVTALNILMPRVMKSKITLAVLLALYVSKAFVHYYGILDYTASDLFFFSLARVFISDKKPCVIKDSVLRFTAVAVVFVATNCIYSYFYVTGVPHGTAKAALYLIRAVCSVSGIITVCSAAEYISSKKAARLLCTAGLYSYDIYLMHAPFLVSGCMGLLLAYTTVPIPLACSVALVSGLFLPYVVSRFVIRKIPLLSVLILGKGFKNNSVSNVNKITPSA